MTPSSAASNSCTSACAGGQTLLPSHEELGHSRTITWRRCSGSRAWPQAGRVAALALGIPSRTLRKVLLKLQTADVSLPRSWAMKVVNGYRNTEELGRGDRRR